MLSLFVLLFWITGHVIDIYRFAIVGVFFEMLWLPMLAALIILPIVAFIFWVKEKLIASSLNMFTILIGVTTILIKLFS